MRCNFNTLEITDATSLSLNFWLLTKDIRSYQFIGSGRLIVWRMCLQDDFWLTTITTNDCNYHYHNYYCACRDNHYFAQTYKACLFCLGAIVGAGVAGSCVVIGVIISTIVCVIVVISTIICVIVSIGIILGIVSLPILLQLYSVICAGKVTQLKYMKFSSMVVLMLMSPFGFSQQ